MADTSQTAPVLEYSYDGLAQRLSQLSEFLTTMAKEGEGKGVYVVHLRFQATRIAQAHAYLQQFNAVSAPRHLRAVVHGLTSLARHVHTYYPWSTYLPAAGNLVSDIVVRAERLIHQ